MTTSYNHGLFLVLCLLCWAPAPVVGDCLPEAVREKNRTYIQDIDGNDIPIGFLRMDWRSSVIATAIARILVEEVLGYHTTADADPALRSRYAFLALAGCQNYNDAEGPLCASGTPDLRIHIAMATWLGTNIDSWDEVQEMFSTYAPKDLGAMGWTGREHMFVKKQTLLDAYEAEGVMLDFYKGYNVSHHKVHKYFDSIFDIDSTMLKPCHFPGSTFQDTVLMATYLRWTGDRDGVLEVNDGKFIAKCDQTHWWVSPACRYNISECIPVLTYGGGFHAETFMQWAAFHSVPMAIGVARNWSAYTDLVRKSQAAFYWWIPEVTFLDLEPQPVIFPEHSPKEWDDYLMRTAAKGGYVNKASSYDLHFKAELVSKLISDLRLEMSEMDQLMLDVANSNSSNPIEDVACKWIRSTERWRAWIPVVTNCDPGFGFANDAGEHVLTRAEATGCSLCQPGSWSELYSDGDGVSHRCIQCSQGTSQNEAGELKCAKCAPGSVSSTTGAVECELCTVGRYANSSGMTECTACDPGNPELTTIHEVDLDGRIERLQFKGASSAEFCTCPASSFLYKGKCEGCQRGSSCPGSGKLTLNPGFWSAEEDPGSVFQCFNTPGRCPGGEPGMCALGRDTDSLACSLCLPGWYEQMGVCTECRSSDYVFIAGTMLVVTTALGVLHFTVLGTGGNNRRSQSLIMTGLALSQMVFFLQVMSTIRLFNISWGEPFASVLLLLESISTDTFLRSLTVFSCISRVDSLTVYVNATLLLPTFLLLVPLLAHLLYLVCRRPGSWKLHRLGKTCGMLYVLLYISLCTNLLQPFRCHTHPNDKATLKSFDGVLCNMEGVHWKMSLVAAGGFLFPIGFLALCFWVIICEYPKRVAHLDVKFMRLTAFLTFRFRPGKEWYAVLFSLRDTFIVLSASFSASSISIVCLTLLLYTNVILVAHDKPWRTPQASILSIVVCVAILSLLDLGSFFVDRTDSPALMIASTVMTICLVVVILCLAATGVVKHLASAHRKAYRFFLCHHKLAAGSLARLLKIHIQKRGPNLSTFVDTDDLTDLADLFGLVAQQVETLVVLASSEILHRKWCVGEMVTAYVQKRQTVLVLLPDFEKPSQPFIDNYLFIVPEIKDLAGYSISIEDVQATLEWLRTLEALELNSLAHPEAVDDVVGKLTATAGDGTVAAATDVTECVIVADPDNMEAMATAYVLFEMLSPLMIKDRSATAPGVLTKHCDVPRNITSVLLICSQDCLESAHVAKWILQTSSAEFCTVLPIIAEDSFQFPANASTARLLHNPSLKHLDVHVYARVVLKIFEEVAIYFSARASSAAELNLRLDQLAQRLRTVQPKSLSTRLSKDIGLSPSLRSTSSAGGRTSLSEVDDSLDGHAFELPTSTWRSSLISAGYDENTDGKSPVSSDRILESLEGPLVQELV